MIKKYIQRSGYSNCYAIGDIEMNIDEAIFTRRSVRQYIDKPVEDERIKEILKAGQWAPSACNYQNWRFIVIKDYKRRDKLVKAGILHLTNVPVGIFVLYENQRINKEYRDHIQSAAAAIQNMLLKAHAIGFGACCVCHLPSKKKLRKLLSIPLNYDPIALVTVGYYDKNPEVVKRKKGLNEIFCYDRFDFNKRGMSYTGIFLNRVYFKIYSWIKKIFSFVNKL